jgi:hypothetical protein
MIRRKHFDRKVRPDDQAVAVSVHIGGFRTLSPGEPAGVVVESMISERLNFIYGEITDRLSRLRVEVHMASGLGANYGKIDHLFDELIAFIRDTNDGSS